MFLILLLKLLTQFPFVSFLFISISQPSLFSLSTIPSFSILCPPKIKTSIYYTMAHFCILFHTMTYLFFLIMHSISLKKTKFLCLSSILSYPDDLKKEWLPFSILSLLPFLISPSLSSIPSCSSDQFAVLLR